MKIRRRHPQVLQNQKRITLEGQEECCHSDHVTSVPTTNQHSATWQGLPVLMDSTLRKKDPAVDEETILCIHNGTFSSHKEQQSYVHCKKMDATKDVSKSQKDKCCIFFLIYVSQMSQTHIIECVLMK